MRLAISNIAWDPQDLDVILAQMAAHGVTGLEIAPGLAFPGEADPFVPSDRAIQMLRTRLADHGVALVSMQSLLFGVEGANLFGSPDERGRFTGGLERAIELSGALGIPNLVLGSPKQRVIPAHMSSDEAEEIARSELAPLAAMANTMGAALALEPNPAMYGTNFLTTADETLAFVHRSSLPGLTMNFDIGALIVNNDTDRGGLIFAEGREWISHVHISEPHLRPAPSAPPAFASLARDILACGYDRWFSIEMRKPDGDHIAAIDASLRAARTALEQACAG